MRTEYAGCEGPQSGLSKQISHLSSMLWWGAGQVAANNRGIQLVGDLIAEYGLPVVHAYMGFIQVSFPLHTVEHTPFFRGLRGPLYHSIRSASDACLHRLRKVRPPHARSLWFAQAGFNRHP